MYLPVWPFSGRLVIFHKGHKSEKMCCGPILIVSFIKVEMQSDDFNKRKVC